MAHKKAAGSTSLGRDSAGKRLGIKLADGQFAKVGSIIVRQKGTKYFPGKNVKKGKDDTLFAMLPGFVKFTSKNIKKYDGRIKKTTFANVLPQ